VEEFGLNSSLQVLFVKLMIFHMEEDEKDRRNVVNYRGLQNKGALIKPKVSTIKKSLQTELFSSWKVVLQFEKLGSSKWLGQLVSVLDRENNWMLCYIK